MVSVVRSEEYGGRVVTCLSGVESEHELKLVVIQLDDAAGVS